jgi:hypothetical protein
MTAKNQMRRWSGAIALGLASLCLSGCAGGETVTTQSLQAARQQWEGAGIRSYDLEWTNSGPGNPRYRVEVRNAVVQRLRIVLPDGTTRETTTHDTGYFSVEGLFKTIADELEQLRTNEPFGKPKGSSVVMRFTPDPKYGFPRSYRRDVAGSARAVWFDVLQFEPVSAPRASAPGG